MQLKISPKQTIQLSISREWKNGMFLCIVIGYTWQCLSTNGMVLFSLPAWNLRELKFNSLTLPHSATPWLKFCLQSSFILLSTFMMAETDNKILNRKRKF